MEGVSAQVGGLLSRRGSFEKQSILLDSQQDIKHGEFCKGNDSLTCVACLLKHVAINGLRLSDPRLKPLLTYLESQEDLTNQELDISSLEGCETLIDQAIDKQLIIPDFQDFASVIESIFNECRENSSGETAQYIPQLARANADLWGLSVCTVDGQRMSLGDTTEQFTIQSTSKPISYAMLLHHLGHETVHKYEGCEPSGRIFNEIVLDYNDKPHNPMVNSGAIMSAALLLKLVNPEMNRADKYDMAFNFFKKMAGGEYIGFDNAVFMSEKDNADRNTALAFFMRENKCFPSGVDMEDINSILDFYYQLCSLKATCESWSVVASTLANGGKCPITNEQVVKTSEVRHVLSLMHSCGMTKFGGQFAFNVGLPAKSGISGVVMLVVPNVMGAVMYSPRLDMVGNSVRGVEFCEKLVKKYRFHVFDGVDKSLNKKDPTEKKQEKTLIVSKILTAATQGNLFALKKAHVAKMDLNLCDYSGRTALHQAAMLGHALCVQYLLEDCGVMAEPRDRWGVTPAQEAVRSGHLNIEKIIAQYVGQASEELLTEDGWPECISPVMGEGQEGLEDNGGGDQSEEEVEGGDRRRHSSKKNCEEELNKRLMKIGNGKQEEVSECILSVIEQGQEGLEDNGGGDQSKEEEEGGDICPSKKNFEDELNRRLMNIGNGKKEEVSDCVSSVMGQAKDGLEENGGGDKGKEEEEEGGDRHRSKNKYEEELNMRLIKIGNEKKEEVLNRRLMKIGNGKKGVSECVSPVLRQGQEGLEDNRGGFNQGGEEEEGGYRHPSTKNYEEELNKRLMKINYWYSSLMKIGNGKKEEVSECVSPVIENKQEGLQDNGRGDQSEEGEEEGGDRHPSKKKYEEELNRRLMKIGSRKKETVSECVTPVIGQEQEGLEYNGGGDQGEEEEEGGDIHQSKNKYEEELNMRLMKIGNEKNEEVSDCVSPVIGQGQEDLEDWSEFVSAVMGRGQEGLEDNGGGDQSEEEGSDRYPSKNYKGELNRRLMKIGNGKKEEVSDCVSPLMGQGKDGLEYNGGGNQAEEEEEGGDRHPRKKNYEEELNRRLMKIGNGKKEEVSECVSLLMGQGQEGLEDNGGGDQCEEEEEGGDRGPIKKIYEEELNRRLMKIGNGKKEEVSECVSLLMGQGQEDLEGNGGQSWRRSLLYEYSVHSKMA